MSPTRAQIYRRRRVAVFGGLTVVLMVIAYLPMTLLAPVAAVTPAVVEYAAVDLPEPTLSWPEGTAGGIGAVGFDGVLAAEGTDQPVSIASISKVVTALMVLEKHPLELGEQGPSLTFTSADEQFWHYYISLDGGVKPVRAGLSLTEYQTMQAVLIASANNYTRSLALWAFGTDQGFASAASDWLTRNNLSSTTIVEPTGIDPRNQSTVADLLELGKLALANPVMAELVSTTTVDLPYIGKIGNTNKILGSIGVDGIKTGTLPEAGACLLFSTDIMVGEKSITVVGVALGGDKHPEMNAQILKLLESVTDDFHEMSLVEKGRIFGTYTTPWGQDATAVASEAGSLLVWGDPDVHATVTVNPVGIAVAGTPVGNVVFTVGADTVTVPLVLGSEITDPGVAWRLSNPFG